MEAIVQRSAGLDVHKKVIVVTILLEQPDETVKEETREYGTHYQACEDLADWLSSQNIELSVMESTGIFSRLSFWLYDVWQYAFRDTCICPT